jgi:uncharacterized protein
MTQGASLQDLINRIGSEHVERRLEIEIRHEAQLFGQGLLLFNVKIGNQPLGSSKRLSS